MAVVAVMVIIVMAVAAVMVITIMAFAVVTVITVMAVVAVMVITVRNCAENTLPGWSVVWARHDLNKIY